MNEKQIFAIVQDIISHMFDVNPDSVESDTDLLNQFALDSLDKVEIFTRLEHRLHCNFSTDEEDLFYETFNKNPTPQTIVDLALQKLKNTHIKIHPQATNILYTKSVPELVTIIEQQRAEIIKLKNQKKR